jgi:hypothetical protein
MQPDDAAAQLPPLSVEPTSAPFDLPETHKVCPDCARGVEAPGIIYPRASLRPIEEFYEQKGAKRYKGEVRHSAYCKPHQRKRNNAYRKGKADPTVAERVARSVKRTGYERKPERKARKLKIASEWNKSNPERVAQHSAEWTKRHRKRREKIQRESLLRRARGETARPGPKVAGESDE